jgi:hypothetical protein
MEAAYTIRTTVRIGTACKLKKLKYVHARVMACAFVYVCMLLSLSVSANLRRRGGAECEAVVGDFWLSKIGGRMRVFSRGSQEKSTRRSADPTEGTDIKGPEPPY